PKGTVLHASPARVPHSGVLRGCLGALGLAWRSYYSMRGPTTGPGVVECPHGGRRRVGRRSKTTDQVQDSAAKNSAERFEYLAAVLAGSARAQVAGRDVDHPVRHLDLGEHLLLPREQALVLGVRLLLAAVDEHLDLVELVHADDPASVLAIGAGLAAEARRPS